MAFQKEQMAGLAAKIKNNATETEYEDSNAALEKEVQKTHEVAATTTELAESTAAWADAKMREMMKEQTLLTHAQETQAAQDGSSQKLDAFKSQVAELRQTNRQLRLEVERKQSVWCNLGDEEKRLISGTKGLSEQAPRLQAGLAQQQQQQYTSRDVTTRKKMKMSELRQDLAAAVATELSEHKQQAADARAEIVEKTIATELAESAVAQANAKMCDLKRAQRQAKSDAEQATEVVKTIRELTGKGAKPLFKRCDAVMTELVEKQEPLALVKNYQEAQEVVTAANELSGNAAVRVGSLLFGCVDRGNENIARTTAEIHHLTDNEARLDSASTESEQCERTLSQQQYERQLSSETVRITLRHKKMLQGGKSNHSENVILQYGKSNHAENLDQAAKIAYNNGKALCALIFLSTMTLLSLRIRPAKLSVMLHEVEMTYIEYSASKFWLQHPTPSLFHETVLKVGLPFTLI